MFRFLAIEQSLIHYDSCAYVTDPLAHLRDVFVKCDAVFTNLEVGIESRFDWDAKANDKSVFQTTGPEAFDFLRSSGVNALAVANNHSAEVGPHVFNETLSKSRELRFVVLVLDVTL